MENEPIDTPETATLRHEIRRVDAIVTAHYAAMAAVLLQFRMVGVRRPFSGGIFNHLRGAGERLTLCTNVTCIALQDGPVDLAEVDCIGCLDVFAERTRP